VDDETESPVDSLEAETGTADEQDLGEVAAYTQLCGGGNALTIKS
jgi:hypothetical protein